LPWWGSSSGEIAVRGRKARINTTDARDEVLSLYVAAEMLASPGAAANLIATVTEQLRGMLFLVECHFDPTITEIRSPYIDRTGELNYFRLGWPLEVEGLPNRNVLLPVECRGHLFGCLVLRGPGIGVPLTQDRRLTAIALSDLAGAALNAEPESHRSGRRRTPSNH
jgi:hypothetical protein